MKYICNRNASALHPLLFRVNYYDLNLVLGYSFGRAKLSKYIAAAENIQSSTDKYRRVQRNTW